MVGSLELVRWLSGWGEAAMSKKDYIVGLVSCAGEEEARTIARQLVESRLVACAHIVPGIHAIYRWEGRIEEDPQTLIVIKTIQSVWPEIVQQVSLMHSDQVPEIIALPIVDGLSSYLAWIDDVVDSSDRQS